MIGILAAFALPKRVECSFADEHCLAARNELGMTCRPYEVEPWGFHLIERIAGRDIGFAYSSGEECR